MSHKRKKMIRWTAHADTDTATVPKRVCEVMYPWKALEISLLAQPGAFVENDRTLLPPRGYVARWARSSPFCATPFMGHTLFFGASVFSCVGVDWRFNLPEEVCTNLKTFQPDEPLGRGGRVGLYYRWINSVYEWIVVVWSGLSESELGSFEDSLMSKEAPKTWEEALPLFGAMHKKQRELRDRVARRFEDLLGVKIVPKGETCWNTLRDETAHVAFYSDACVPSSFVALYGHPDTFRVIRWDSLSTNFFEGEVCALDAYDEKRRTFETKEPDVIHVGPGNLDVVAGCFGPLRDAPQLTDVVFSAKWVWHAKRSYDGRVTTKTSPSRWEIVTGCYDVDEEEE